MLLGWSETKLTQLLSSCVNEKIIDSTQNEISNLKKTKKIYSWLREPEKNSIDLVKKIGKQS